jgi:hypothetical protein
VGVFSVWGLVSLGGAGGLGLSSVIKRGIEAKIGGIKNLESHALNPQQMKNDLNTGAFFSSLQLGLPLAGALGVKAAEGMVGVKSVFHQLKYASAYQAAHGTAETRALGGDLKQTVAATAMGAALPFGFRGLEKVFQYPGQVFSRLRSSHAIGAWTGSSFSEEFTAKIEQAQKRFGINREDFFDYKKLKSRQRAWVSRNHVDNPNNTTTLREFQEGNSLWTWLLYQYKSNSHYLAGVMPIFSGRSSPTKAKANPPLPPLLELKEKTFLQVGDPTAPVRAYPIEFNGSATILEGAIGKPTQNIFWQAIEKDFSCVAAASVASLSILLMPDSAQAAIGQVASSAKGMELGPLFTLSLGMAVVFNRRKIIHALKRLQRAIGTKPFSNYELNDAHKRNPDIFPSESMVQREFGTFNRAKEVAGLELNVQGRRVNGQVWSTQEIIQFLQELGNQKGRTPVLNDIGEAKKLDPSIPGSSAIAGRFGGKFSAALEAAGFTPNLENATLVSLNKYGGEAGLIRHLQNLARSLGRTPYAADIMKARKADKANPPHHIYYNHFGSLNEAYRRAGLVINLEHGRFKRFSANQIKKYLQDKFAELGRSPSVEEINDFYRQDRTLPSRQNIIDAFGSVNNAFKEAGLAPIIPEYGKAELIRDLQDLSRELGGKTPSIEDIKAKRKKEIAAGNTFSPHSAFENYFGSIKLAQEEAGLKVNWYSQVGERKYTRDEIIQSYRNLANYLGKLPTSTDVNQASSRDPDFPCWLTMKKQFPDIKDLRRAAGL